MQTASGTHGQCMYYRVPRVAQHPWQEESHALLAVTGHLGFRGCVNAEGGYCMSRGRGAMHVTEHFLQKGGNACRRASGASSAE